MPLTLISRTGALQFRPSRALFMPVLVDPEYQPPSSEPDEIIEPARTEARKNLAARVRASLLAFLLFGILQAVVLAPPLYIARFMPA